MATPEERFEVGEEVVWDLEALPEHVLDMAKSFQSSFGEGPYRIVRIGPDPSEQPLHPQMLYVEFGPGMAVDMSGHWFRHVRH